MKNVFIILLLPSVFFGCGKIDKTQIQNLSGNTIMAIGHGGSGFKSFINYLPMNTLESMQAAMEKSNADGVEMDVQLSAEHQLIVFHDELLEKSTDCNGFINSQVEKELTECIYSSFFCRITGREFHVVALEKVIRHFSKSANRPFLTFDLKLYRGKSMDNEEYIRQFATAVSELVRKYDYEDKVFIESTSQELLSELKSANAELKLFIYPSDFEPGILAAKELGLYGITIRNNLISKEQVEQAHQNGFRVTIWGTKSKKSNRDAILKNPDFIQTDNINNLTSLLN